MTDISALNGIGTTRQTGSDLAAAGLDQNAFLRLMTTQLTTQDPFNPVDNTQMVAQMAQFSQVAGIAEMNQNLRAIPATLGGAPQ
jgi:flagellar basal-body rod modification protein FlgD